MDNKINGKDLEFVNGGINCSEEAISTPDLNIRGTSLPPGRQIKGKLNNCISSP